MRALTKHQRETLLRLGRYACPYRGAARPGRWVLDRDCGGPSALDRLYEKGYVEREVRYGPRGGEHVYYRPNTEGWRVYDRHFFKVASHPNARRTMPAHEIDTRLIEARRKGEAVLVYCGSPAYVRGVPGEVERDDDSGVVVLLIGQRKVALMAITEVTAG